MKSNTVIDDPLWTRMPTPGEKLECLSRHSIYRLVESGAVRFRSVKLRPDAKRGVPFVSRADILKLIDNSPSASDVLENEAA
jgi:hypothetical protein